MFGDEQQIPPAEQSDQEAECNETNTDRSSAALANRTDEPA
jgi:hypothetical protein